jgi:hypothetical protein
MFVRRMFACLWLWAQLPNDSAGNSVGIIEVVRPKPNYPPAGISERFCLEAVPDDVALKLRKPVTSVGRRLATVFRAAVPEAAVHENNEALSTKREIWAARQRLVTPPPGDSVLAKYGGKPEFCFLIPARTNAGHHLRALFFGEDVWHRLSLFYQGSY